MTYTFPQKWAIPAAAAALMAITMGSRSSFGLFASPLNTATGLGLAIIGLAFAASQLAWGLAQPFIGALAERYGAGRVISCGAVVTALATLLIATMSSAGGLTLAFALVAIGGVAMGSNALLMSATERSAAAGQRGLAAGIVSAGGSAGQVVLVPLVQAVVSYFGWTSAVVLLALLALLALPLAQVFTRTGDGTPAVANEPRQALGEALRSRDFWLIAGGFFVCGFHVSFLVAHMPMEIELCGLSPALAGPWIALVGVCNVVGSLVSGAAIERVSMRRLLMGLYLARAAGVAAFIAAPKTPVTVLLFGLWMGLSYMATVPPTTGLVARLFGTQRMATLLGVVMLIHQIGAFLGVWLGGIALETGGSLRAMWIADVVLALGAAALQLPLREHQQPRPALAVALPVLLVPSAGR